MSLHSPVKGDYLIFYLRVQLTKQHILPLVLQENVRGILDKISLAEQTCHRMWHSCGNEAKLWCTMAVCREKREESLGTEFWESILKKEIFKRQKEISGSYGISILAFSGISNYFPQELHQFAVPTKVHKAPFSSHPRQHVIC